MENRSTAKLCLCWLLILVGCGPNPQTETATQQTNPTSPPPVAQSSPSPVVEASPCAPVNDNPDTQVDAAIDRMGQKQYSAAIELLDCAIAEYPKAARLYSVRGMAFMAEARKHGAPEFTRAIQDFDVAIQIDPNYAEAYFLRGNSYGELDHYDEALSNYTAAIQINPSWATPYVNRGSTYIEKGETEAAILDFTRATEVGSPREAGLGYDNLYITYSRTGRHDLAAKALEGMEECERRGYTSEKPRTDFDRFMLKLQPGNGGQTSP